MCLSVNALFKGPKGGGTEANCVWYLVLTTWLCVKMTLQLKPKETWKHEKAANFCVLILAVLRGFFHLYQCFQGYELIQALFQTLLLLSAFSQGPSPEAVSVYVSLCDGRMGSSQSLDPSIKSSAVHNLRGFLRRYLSKLTSVQMISSLAHLFLFLIWHRSCSIECIILIFATLLWGNC